MAAASWKDLDERRLALKKPLSRAEWARRAGVSESTITKGLKPTAGPVRNAQRRAAEQVLEEAEKHDADLARRLGRVGEAMREIGGE